MIRQLTEQRDRCLDITKQLEKDFKSAIRDKEVSDLDADKIIAARDLWKRACHHLDQVIACIEDAESRVVSTGKFKAKLVAET